jgi:hypothetical protein
MGDYGPCMRMLIQSFFILPPKLRKEAGDRKASGGVPAFPYFLALFFGFRLNASTLLFSGADCVMGSKFMKL